MGDRLPVLERTLALPDLVAYAGATWDWYRAHYDVEAAVEAGFHAPVVDGQMLGALLAGQALDWGGPRAFVRRLSFRLGSAVFAGEAVRCEGEVRDVRTEHRLLVVSLAQRVLVGERAAIDQATLTLELPI